MASKSNRLTKFKLLLLSLVGLSLSQTLEAQVWPSKPIRFIIPFAPGGVVDYMGREFAQNLSVSLGVPVIVENKGGAAGVIGVDLVAKAPSDGYTIAFANGGTIAIAPHFIKPLPYDPLKDLIPVAPIASVANVIVVPHAHPANSVAEFIGLAKASPDKLNYGSAGMGASDHMATLLFMSMARISMTNVPYKGGGPAIVDLLAGNIDVVFSTFPPAIGHIKAGKLKALGVTASKRLSILPDVPTIAEAGVPGYESDAWYGLFVATGTTGAIVERLNTEINRILKESERMHLRLNESGAVALLQTPEEFKTFVANESVKWQNIVEKNTQVVK